MKNIYEVTVEGDYYASVNGLKSIKRYEFQFLADDTMKEAGLLSVFRNGVSPKDGAQDGAILRKFKKEFPDFRRVRTHCIIGTINLTNQNAPVKELALMNRAQLMNYIEGKAFPIDCGLYVEIGALRQALRDYAEAVKKDSIPQFIKRQDKLRDTSLPQIKVRQSVEDLNSEEFVAKLKKQNEEKKEKLKKTLPVLPDVPDVVDDADLHNLADLDNDSAYAGEDSIPEIDDEDELLALTAGI